MPHNDLQAALNKLNEELGKIDDNDLQSKELLEQLVASVQLKLKEPANQENHTQLVKKIEAKAIHFEVKHPLISKTLEEIIDILVRLGI